MAATVFTVRDVCTFALIEIGSLGQGQTANASELQDLYNRLNDIVDEWNADILNLPGPGTADFALTANDGDYTMGPAGIAPFNVTRPSLIQSAHIRIGGLRQDLEIADAVKWASIREPGALAELPLTLWPQYRTEDVILNLHPKPKCTNVTTLELFTWTPLTLFADLNVELKFPAAYVKALKYTLAVHAAASFRAKLRPDTAQIAANAHQALRDQNARLLERALGQASAGVVPVIGGSRQSPPAAPPPAQ